jgi:hypothetical protein
LPLYGLMDTKFPLLRKTISTSLWRENLHKITRTDKRKTYHFVHHVSKDSKMPENFKRLVKEGSGIVVFRHYFREMAGEVMEFDFKVFPSGIGIRTRMTCEARLQLFVQSIFSYRTIS